MLKSFNMSAQLSEALRLEAFNRNTKQTRIILEGAVRELRESEDPKVIRLLEESGEYAVITHDYPGLKVGAQ